MNRLKIMIDMDGVLANFLFGYNRIEEKLGLKNTPWSSPWNAFWNDDVWAVIKTSPDYWYNLPCMLTKQELRRLRVMCREHDVYFVTARLGISPKQQTEQWLFKRGVTNPTVLIAADGRGGAKMKLSISYGIGAQFSIDDRMKNVEEIATNKDCASVLAVTRQNAHEIWEPRSDTFTDFLDLIELEAK